MIIIRNYIESDAKALWNIFFNTVRHINSRDYSQAQVETLNTYFTVFFFIGKTQASIHREFFLPYSQKYNGQNR